jgi:hypothetical protein
MLVHNYHRDPRVDRLTGTAEEKQRMLDTSVKLG